MKPKTHKQTSYTEFVGAKIKEETKLELQERDINISAEIRQHLERLAKRLKEKE